MTETKYDIFISWAHADREEDILHIKREITENYKQFAPDAEELKIFTDHAIEMGDDWAVKIQDALKNSDLFIAILSPNYFKSDYCAHEMHMWKQNEIIKGILNKASLPVYYIELKENPFETDNKAIKEAFIQQSNTKLKPWFTEGQTKLYEEEIKKRIASEITAEKINDKLTKIQNSKISYTNTPKPNRDFVGRVSELTGIRLRYAEMPDRIPLLHGAAGVGKTELAFAYAWAYASEYPGGRYLIKAEGAKTIPDAFARLLEDTYTAEKLGINTETLTDEEKRDTEILMRNRIKPAILKKEERILIILDNIDNPQEILSTADTDKYLSWRNDETIHILATTRKDTLKTNENEPACPYPINDMAEHDALELLRNKKPFDTEDEKQAAKEIIEYIGGNAWALSMTAESLKQNKRYTYRRKADSLKQLKNVEYIREEDKRVKTRHGAIDTEELLNPTLELLNEQERYTADIASLLHPDYVYVEWLKQLFIQKYEQDEEPEDAEDDWLDVKEKLEQLHIISTEDNSGCSRMHRLTGYVLRKQTENKQEKITELAEIIQKRIDDGYKTVNKEETLAIIQTADKLTGIPNCFDTAVKLISRKFYDEMVRRYIPSSKEYTALLEKIVSDRKEILGEDHPDTIGAMHALAYRYSDLGRYEEAVKLAEEVLEKRKEILGEKHPDTLSAMNNLACMYSDLGKYEEAVKLSEEVLEKRKEILGENHLNTIDAMNNLANHYSYLGRYEEAVKLAAEVLEKRKEILGEKHPDTQNAMNNLACMYSDLGRYEEAVQLSEEVLEKRREILGEEHPYTITAMNNLAIWYSNLGRYEEAVKLSEEVLEKRREILGENHPHTLTAMNNLAGIYDNLNRTEDAQKIRAEIEELKAAATPKI